MDYPVDSLFVRVFDNIIKYHTIPSFTMFGLPVLQHAKRQQHVSKLQFFLPWQITI